MCCKTSRNDPLPIKSTEFPTPKPGAQQATPRETQVSHFLEIFLMILLKDMVEKLGKW